MDTGTRQFVLVKDELVLSVYHTSFHALYFEDFKSFTIRCIKHLDAKLMEGYNFLTSILKNLKHSLSVSS